MLAAAKEGIVKVDLDIDEWVRQNVECCACRRTMRKSAHINLVALGKRARIACFINWLTHVMLTFFERNSSNFSNNYAQFFSCVCSKTSGDQIGP